jgi:hypothetical protein
MSLLIYRIKPNDKAFTEINRLKTTIEIKPFLQIHSGGISIMSSPNSTFNDPLPIFNTHSVKSFSYKPACMVI